MRTPSLVLTAVLTGAATLVSAQQTRPSATTPTSGLDLSTFDRSVRPQDDLFRFVNGGWLNTTEIPADRPIAGTFVQLTDKAEADLYAIIERLAGDPNKQPGSIAQQVGDLFASFSNEARVNELGASPLKPTLDRIAAITTPAELARVIGELSVIGLPGPVSGFVDADAGDPTKVALYLFQGGTTLPDRDFYLLDDAKFVEIRAKYLEYLTTSFKLTGHADAAAAARSVLEFETELAKIQ